MKRLPFNNRRPSLVPGFVILLALHAVAAPSGASAAPEDPAQSVSPAGPQTAPAAPSPSDFKKGQPPVVPDAPTRSAGGPEPPSGTPAAPPTSLPPGPPQVSIPSPSEPAIPPSPAQAPPGTGKPGVEQLEYSADTLPRSSPNGDILAIGHVMVKYGDTQVTADRLEGNFNREVIFSGHARLETRGASSYADAIHVYPRTRTFRLDTPRGVLNPEFLEERVEKPVYLTGGELFGTSLGYALGDQVIATTCIEPYHHYEFRIKQAELIPHRKLILRQVGVFFFGVKVITLPIVVIPLDLAPRRRPRSNYMPEIGQNPDEGYYVRLPYTFAEGDTAGTFVRLDITQKKGEGYRLEQEYLAGKQDNPFNTAGQGVGGGFTGATTGVIAGAYGYNNVARLPTLGTGLGPQNGGLLALQGYFAEGFNKDFNASFRHQQGIGSNNRFGFDTELQRNSFYVGDGQTNETAKFTFDHADAAHGVNGGLTINVNENDSKGTTSSHAGQITGDLRQSFDFASKGTNRNALSYDFDFSRNTTETTGFASTISQLNSQLQFQHSARDYSLALQANKSFDLGSSTSNGVFGTLERLPELVLNMDTQNFKGGALRAVPAQLQFGVGSFTEPSSGINDERIDLGVNIPDFAILKGRTEILTSGGFEQRMYSDGAAQYDIHDQTRLRRHLGGRSGFDLTYNYEQPAGGTPFLFDSFGHTHDITAEAGYLDDSHFQATAQVGYSLLGQPAGVTPRPFQTLSTRLMWRPTPSFRYDAMATYDPNTSVFTTFTNYFRMRARNDFAVDLLGRYDPSLHKFSQINTQFDVPLGRTWRIAGLMQYDGVLHQFDSRNLQIIHEWDCLEATLTYSDNPLSFRSGASRQIFFTLRIKGLPFGGQGLRGPAGQALGPGIGSGF